MNSMVGIITALPAALPAWLPWLLVAAVGLFGSMIFSGMETGFYVLSRPRLQLRGWKKDPAALRLDHWIKKARRPAGRAADMAEYLQFHGLGGRCRAYPPGPIFAHGSNAFVRVNRSSADAYLC